MAAPSSRKPTALDAYETLGVVGKGSFGTVHRIRRKVDKRNLVWKEMNYGSMREKERSLVVSEVNILRELRHPYIVRYYDRIIDKSATKIYIVMEHCEGGDLGAVIRKCKREGRRLDEDTIWRYFSQVLLALKECHQHVDEAGVNKPILHRDLKPGNVFLDRANNVKVGDFGLAKELTSASKFAFTNVGTPFYMSPELINESKYNAKSDIWALGCLLFELAALRPPFEAQNQLSLAIKINGGQYEKKAIHGAYSDDLRRTIRWLLTKDASKRPRLEDLERLPRVRHHIRESQLTIREYKVHHMCSIKAHDMKQRESSLKEREAALRKDEVSLREREAVLKEREAALKEREARLLERETALATRESREGTTAVAPTSKMVAPPPIPMSRARSLSSGSGGRITPHVDRPSSAPMPGSPGRGSTPSVLKPVDTNIRSESDTAEYKAMKRSRVVAYQRGISREVKESFKDAREAKNGKGPPGAAPTVDAAIPRTILR